MSRIGKAFQSGKVFIPFLIGGDPSLEMTGELICAMAGAGADLIEIGVPFSDPVAESAALQAAGGRALAAGCTTDKLFDLVAKVRKEVEVPLVFVTYANSIYTYGKEAFMRRCRESGVDGLMVQDLPYEEKEEISPECEQYGVDLISVTVPASHERIQMIAKEAKGFLYCVPSKDVLGAGSREKVDTGELVRLAKAVSGIPGVLALNGGSLEQVKAMAALADGVIERHGVSELVDRYGTDSVGPVVEYVRKMKDAVQER